MADENPITDSLAQSAAGPRSVSVEGMGSSSEHSIRDQIAAAKFLPPAAVRRRVGKGIRFVKATAGGAV